MSHDTSNLRRSESSRARAVYLRPRNSFAQNLAFSSDTISPGFQFPISDSTAIASFDVKPIPCRSSNKSGLSTTSWLRRFPRKESYRASTQSVTCNKNAEPSRYLSSSYLRNVEYRLRALDSLRPKNWSVSTLSKKIGISGALEIKGWLSNQDRPVNLWKPGLLPASTLTGQFWVRKMFVTLSDKTSVLEFAAAICLELKFGLPTYNRLFMLGTLTKGRYVGHVFNMHVEYFEWCKCYRRMQETPIYANRRESSRWWPLPTLTQIHRVLFEIMTRNWHFHVEYTCCSLSPATSVNTLIPVKASWVMTIARCRAHSISFLWKIWKPRHGLSLISSKQPGKGPALLNARRWSTCVLNQWIITHPSPACRLAWNFLSRHARETAWPLNGVGKKQKHERKTKNSGQCYLFRRVTWTR